MHHTISTIPGWSGTPVFRINGDTPKVTGMHIAAAPSGIDYNIAVSAPLLARLMSESFRLPKDYLNCPLTGNSDTIALFESSDDCPFDVSLDEVSTRTKMLRAEKDKARAQYKKSKKASNTKGSQRKRAKDKGAAPNKRHGGKTVLARMSSRDYEKLKQAASLIADNVKAREETKRVYRKLLEIEDQIESYKLLSDGLEGDAIEIARLSSKRDAILANFKSYAEMHARVSYRKFGQLTANQFDSQGRGPPERRWVNLVDSDDEDRDEEGFFEGTWNESMFPWRNSAKEAVFREIFVDFDLTEVPEEPSQVCAEDEVAIPHLRGVRTSALMPQPADKRRLKTELLALPESSDTRRVVTSIKLFEAIEDDHRVWNSLARNILDRVLSSGSSDRFIIPDGTALHLFTVVWEDPGSPDSAVLVERRLHDGSVSFVCSEQGVQITPSEYVDCDPKKKNVLD